MGTSETIQDYASEGYDRMLGNGSVILGWSHDINGIFPKVLPREIIDMLNESDTPDDLKFEIGERVIRITRANGTETNEKSPSPKTTRYLTYAETLEQPVAPGRGKTVNALYNEDTGEFWGQSPLVMPGRPERKRAHIPTVWEILFKKIF